jgi:hypothetical protein
VDSSLSARCVANGKVTARQETVGKSSASVLNSGIPNSPQGCRDKLPPGQRRSSVGSVGEGHLDTEAVSGASARLTSLQYLRVADKQAVIALSPIEMPILAMPLCPVNPHEHSDPDRRSACWPCSSTHPKRSAECAESVLVEFGLSAGFWVPNHEPPGCAENAAFTRMGAGVFLPSVACFLEPPPMLLRGPRLPKASWTISICKRLWRFSNRSPGPGLLQPRSSSAQARFEDAWRDGDIDCLWPNCMNRFPFGIHSSELDQNSDACLGRLSESFPPKILTPRTLGSTGSCERRSDSRSRQSLDRFGSNNPQLL